MNWTANDVMDLATAYWKSATLSAAVDLKLFDAVCGEGLTADAAAQRVHASPLHTEVFSDALVGLGLLERAAGRYRLELSTAPWLDRSSSRWLLRALRFNLELACRQQKDCSWVIYNPAGLKATRTWPPATRS